jgi:hypothetical protein
MTNQQPAPTPQTSKKRRKWPFVVGAIIAIGVVISIANGGSNTPATVSANTPETTSVPNRIRGAEEYPATNAAAPAKVDPLTHDGTWFVGSEIQPGTYRTAKAADAAAMGYWARCSDAACEVGAGLIQNGMAPGLLEIAPTDYAVNLQGLVLTPVG